MTNFQCSITAIQFKHRNFRIYSATGEQLRKVHKQGATPLLTQDYSGGIEYRNAALEAVYHAEGRITPQVEGIRYEYTLTDHLGNGRVYFADRNGDGVGTAGDILQDEHYYPFGLRISDPRRSAGNPANRYQYNGKEWSEESGLGWYAYGARWYDPAVGRWWSVDPMAEKYVGVSGYNYVYNNPFLFVDPDGRSADNIIINENKVVASPGGASTVSTTKYQYGTDSKGNSGFIDPATGLVYSGSNTFIIQVGDALNVLRASPEGKSLVDGLVADPSDIEIVQRKSNGADMTGGAFVTWDPSNTNSAPDESGSTTRPAFIGLAHELAHIEDIKSGTINLGNWVSVNTAKGPISIPNAEIYATHKENLIRKENGLALRKYYGVTSTGQGDPITKIVTKGKSLYYNSAGKTAFNIIAKKSNRFTY